LAFGQLRTTPVENERYRISWSKDGILETKYDDQTTITLATELAKGVWTIRAQLLTDDVKKDLKGVLQDAASIEIR
jgi:hypothetical protein